MSLEVRGLPSGTRAGDNPRFYALSPRLGSTFSHRETSYPLPHSRGRDWLWPCVLAVGLHAAQWRRRIFPAPFRRCRQRLRGCHRRQYVSSGHGTCSCWRPAGRFRSPSLLPLAMLMRCSATQVVADVNRITGLEALPRDGKEVRVCPRVRPDTQARPCLTTISVIPATHDRAVCEPCVAQLLLGHRA